ncbi:MAG: formate dehydrogenase subunit gamma [Variovorax sp.]
MLKKLTGWMAAGAFALLLVAPAMAQAQGTTSSAPSAAAPGAPLASTAAPAPLVSATPGSVTTTPAAAGPPPGFVAPAEPRPGDTNAERAVSQPGNNAPFWRAVRDSGDEKGRSNLPGAEKGVLIQQFVQYPGTRVTTAGEAWRQVRNEIILPYGGALLVITLLALAIFFFARGPIGGHVPYTGRKIERFTAFERAAHWANAIAFCVLAISGIVMAFGKYLLAPNSGNIVFGLLTYALKTTHNFFGPLFVVSLVIVFVVFLRDNFWRPSDTNWLRRGGGLFGGAEPPSGRFNAGEKIVFWLGVFLLGIFVTTSGLFLDHLIPGFTYTRGDMQIAHMVHGVAAMFMMAMFMGHIYIGTIGMRDAYKAMKTGYVDEGWAHEHHALWAEDIRSGKVPAQRTLPARPAVRPAPQASSS